MLRVTVRRLLQLVPILFGLSVVVFLWVRALPGGPAAAALGAHAQQQASVEALAELDRLYGLDRPLHEQYLTYLNRAAHLDFGQSIATRQSVASEIRHRFPATVELALAALVLAVGVGVPLGVLAARHHRGWFDHLSLAATVLVVSVPIFFSAFLLKYLMAVKLGWLPSSGRLDVARQTAHPTGFYVLDSVLTLDGGAFVDAIRHLVLPAVALGSVPLAFIARITRASVLEVAAEDYVRTADAKGMPRRIVTRRHVLRNAVLPVTTMVGLTAGFLLSGAVLVEVVFAWGGMGSLLQQAIFNRDYPVLQGGILFVTVTFVLVNLLVDLTYALLDPRVRVQ